ncbi:hypothetical protein M427DRAFT_131089 [Gonapodya prolifera JEL478]|uniref:C-CAP/cofactor C-like domain-containing protein n=1 Tax=Gonapodya prolifera (strain JEL478) TaxID=1344416 RepID=A0A139AW09_GONPJ|nr:hypothetical protein M427DRAFT_131089 [Gonapodya prolifera JEL478]|eukprot:KXS20910.1 hypothetical protein M427DRAFT_131089 [Gonapodya prolifera JEL478]
MQLNRGQVAGLFALMGTRAPRRIYEKKIGESITLTAGQGRPAPFFLTECERSSFDMSQYLSPDVTVERCKDVSIQGGKILATFTAIHSENITLSISPKDVKTVILDNCNGVTINLRLSDPARGEQSSGDASAPKIPHNFRIFTSGSVGVNVITVEDTTTTTNYQVPDPAELHSHPESAQNRNTNGAEHGETTGNTEIEGEGRMFMRFATFWKADAGVFETQRVNVYGDVVE